MEKTTIKKKRVFFLSIISVLIIVMSLCLVVVMGLQRDSGPRYAFFLYNGGDTFIAEMMSHISLNIADHVFFEVFDANNSQSVQNHQIVDLVDEGFDLLIINPVDRLASCSIVRLCVREGIPVIFFNREPLADALLGNDNVFYVGADAGSLGIKQAELAAGFFTGDTVSVVILKGEHGHQDAEMRTENSVNRLKELGFYVDVLAVHSANWRREDAFEVMRSLYAQFGDSIELVFANNDDMALGAIDYLLEAGVFVEGRQACEQPFIIISVDGTPVGLDAVYRGLIYGTVHNNIAKQSSAILTLADFIVNGRDIRDFPYPITNDHYIYIDGDIITRENVSEFIR